MDYVPPIDFDLGAYYGSIEYNGTYNHKDCEFLVTVLIDALNDRAKLAVSADLLILIVPMDLEGKEGVVRVIRNGKWIWSQPVVPNYQAEICVDRWHNV